MQPSGGKTIGKTHLCTESAGVPVTGKLVRRNPVVPLAQAIAEVIATAASWKPW